MRRRSTIDPSIVRDSNSGSNNGQPDALYTYDVQGAGNGVGGEKRALLLLLLFVTTVV